MGKSYISAALEEWQNRFPGQDVTLFPSYLFWPGLSSATSALQRQGKAPAPHQCKPFSLGSVSPGDLQPEHLQTEKSSSPSCLLACKEPSQQCPGPRRVNSFCRADLLALLPKLAGERWKRWLYRDKVPLAGAICYPEQHPQDRTGSGCFFLATSLISHET